MTFEENNLFIITQERDYFLSHKELKKDFKEVSVKKSEVKKLKKLKLSVITFFLYDYLNSRLYGIYELDLTTPTKEKDEKYFCFNVESKEKKLRRSIYYYDKTKHKDFLISQVKENIFIKLKTKLNIINKPLVQTYLSVEMKKDFIIYKAIETYPHFYEIIRKVRFSKEAYQNLYEKYKNLRSIAGSEKNKKESYLELGRDIANMLIPDADFKNYMLSFYRVVFLSLDENALKIPWEILSFNNVFFSSVITFSYIYSKKLPSQKKDTAFFDISTNEYKGKTKISVAVLKIKCADFDELDKDEKEVSYIESLKNEFVNIEVFTGSFDYSQTIGFLEKYDIVHIITHGLKGGIILKDNFVLKEINSLQKPPLLVFLSLCSDVEEEDVLVKSLLDSDVKTVVSGIGKVSDTLSCNFAKAFYENIFHIEFRVNTAEAFYFASLECESFLRYKFNGIPIVL